MYIYVHLCIYMNIHIYISNNEEGTGKKMKNQTELSFLFGIDLDVFGENLFIL